jgi:putative membrane protein
MHDSSGQDDAVDRSAPEGHPFDPSAITRPAPELWPYYLCMAILSTVALPIILPLLYFRYRTLRYRFADEGVSMAWGLLFRREVYLTYRRVQDIHVSRNILQRWFGLATVGVQTASGSSGPEMSIEGILEYDALRDFLYQKMRGAKGEGEGGHAGAGSTDEALLLLREVRDAMRSIAARERQP